MTYPVVPGPKKTSSEIRTQTLPKWQNKAKPTRAEPSQAGLGQAGPSQDEPRRASPSQAKPGRATLGSLGRADLRRAKRRGARPSRAETSQAKPSQAKPSWTELGRAESSPAGLPGCYRANCCSCSFPLVALSYFWIFTISKYGVNGPRKDFRWTPGFSMGRYRADFECDHFSSEGLMSHAHLFLIFVSYVFRDASNRPSVCNADYKS